MREREFTVEQLASAVEFLEATADFRAANAVLTNIPSAVATSVAAGVRSYEGASWWLVRDDTGVCGCGMQTPPYRAAISPMPTAAAEALATAMLQARPSLRGVMGPTESAATFVARLEALGCPGATRMYLAELVYELVEHTPPAPGDGSPRKATVADVDLLVPWLRDFELEALGAESDPSPEAVARWIGATEPIIWDTAGGPVGLSGRASLVTTGQTRVGRIAPVYVVPEKRGLGYGAAVTNAMVEELLRLDCSHIMLFTDEGYAKSNRVYQRLGFRQVATAAEFGDLEA